MKTPFVVGSVLIIAAIALPGVSADGTTDCATGDFYDAGSNPRLYGAGKYDDGNYTGAYVYVTVWNDATGVWVGVSTTCIDLP